MDHPVRKESGIEEDWGMEVEDEAESRNNLDEQRKRLQSQLRGIERFNDLPQENLQQELQEVEQRKNDFLLEHHMVQKRSQKYTDYPVQEGKHTHKERLRRSERKSIKKRSAFVCCRTRSIRTEG